jgi:hypothetical protein
MVKIITSNLVILYAAFLLATLMLACKKDAQNNNLPVITVYSPQQNSVYSVSDLVPVHAEINDDKLITGITVVLVSTDFLPVAEANYYLPNQKTFLLEDEYPITDQQLETGSYYLQFRADDESGFKNEYIQLTIEGSARALEQIIVITQKDADHLTVSGVSDFETVSELLTIEGDYSASQVSSKHHTLFVSGIEKLNIRAYDLINHQLIWEKGVIPQWPMHHEGCMFFDELLYVTFDYRNIYGYDPKGIEKYHSTIGDYDSPGKIIKHKDLLIVDVQKKNGSDPFIALFYAASGVETQRLTTLFEVVGFHSLEDDVVLIVANTFGQGYIGEYSVSNNFLTDRLLSETHFLSSEIISPGDMYVSTPDYIAHYSAATYTLTPVLLEQGIKQLGYEDLSNILVAASENKLLLLNLPEMTNQKTFLFSDLILNFNLLYSK